MSMPIITSSGVKRCEAITDIIESVALQQTGLSHILNAEGEKIQAILAISKDPEELLAVNSSVESMVNSITRLEVILQGKLELFKDCICTSCDDSTCSTVVTMSLTNAEVGDLIKINDLEYVYVNGSEENAIIIGTDPETTVTLIGDLPDGFKYEDNILYITAGLTGEYELNFKIGDDANACTATIYVRP